MTRSGRINGENLFLFEWCDKQYLVFSKESTPTKDIGTTSDMTTIPVCSLKSMTSNQVHALLHSDGSSWIKQHNKSNNNWQMRRERLERTWGKQGESSQYIWDDIYFCRRSRVHGLVFVRALGRLKPNHFMIHLSQSIKYFLVKTKYWMIVQLL